VAFAIAAPLVNATGFKIEHARQGLLGERAPLALRDFISQFLQAGAGDP
jgi:hypothetical protein